MTQPRLEDLVSKARARPVPWDDAREAEGLVQVMAKVGEPPRGEPRRRTWLVAGAALAAAVVLGLVTAWVRGAPPPETAQLIPPTVATTRLSFPGEAMGYAEPDSHAEVVTATADQVRVRQRQGRIEYHVTPGRPRRFVVDAADVEVTVLGTAFAVSVQAGRVHVEVAHGRVQVRRGDDVVILTDRESVSLSPEPVARPADAGAALEPVPAPPVALVDAGAAPEVLPVERLLEQADALRLQGRYAEAARLLRDAIQASRLHARSPALFFTLARVEQGRGRHAEAARAFERCVSLDPGGPIAEDASAEAAFAWSRAGDAARASAAAKRALEAFPEGIHAARLEGLVK
jgi:transmembrane sensor